MAIRFKRPPGSARRRQDHFSWAIAAERLEDRLLLTNFTPSVIRNFYGINDIQFTYTKLVETNRGPVVEHFTVPGDGTGQTIAIIDEFGDPNIQNDVNVFDQQYNLPPLNLSVVTLPGAKPTSNSWAVEESTDVEWAHAIAPGANIVVINCPGGESNIPAAAVASASYPGVSVVSMSFGYDEFPGEAADDSDFTTPSNHNGVYVSFVAASGDDKTSVVGPQWPAVSPNVLAVGGTVLSVSQLGGIEQSWANSQGGPSLYESEPLYQYGVQQSGVREDPDVAFNASDYSYYDSYSATSAAAPGWAHSSGTSFGAPAWAGLIAIANQGRTLAGDSTLGAYIPQAIYSLSASNFNDIISGPANREGYSPEPGYDEITGRGTPRANVLVPDLVSYIPPLRIPPFPIESVAVSTASGSTPQAVQATTVVGGNVQSPLTDAASDVLAGFSLLTVSRDASASNVPSVLGGKADQSMSQPSATTPVTIVSGGSSVRTLFESDRQSLGGNLSTELNTATINSDRIQWAGLKAAIDILSA